MLQNWKAVIFSEEGKSLSTYFNKSVKYSVQYFMWGNGGGRGRMQLGRWELLGASFSLFSSRPFLSVPGCLQVLDQRLPSSQPTQERQLAEAHIWDQQSFVLPSQLQQVSSSPRKLDRWAGSAAGPGPGSRWGTLGMAGRGALASLPVGMGSTSRRNNPRE